MVKNDRKDDRIDEINRKLDIIARILAYQLVAGKTLTHGAPILKRIGFTATEIAAIYDTSAISVHVRLAESKRSLKTKKKV